MGSLLRLIRSSIQRYGTAEQKPYEALACFYDRMMGHVDYRTWASYIDSLCKKYGNRIHTVIEGACGTGSLAAELETYGYRIAGFDLSGAMLQIARSKSDSDFFQADLRQVPLTTGVDLFLCLYDSILYLKADEIADLFLSAAEIVRPGGLFIFDVVTEAHVLEVWREYFEFDQTGQWKCFRSGWYDQKKRCQHTEIVLRSRRNREKWAEHHCQWVYPLDFFHHQAEKTGWFVTGCFHEFTGKQGSEQSGRVHFVLSRGK